MMNEDSDAATVAVALERPRVEPRRGAPALGSPERTMHDWNRALPFGMMNAE